MSKKSSSILCRSPGRYIMHNIRALLFLSLVYYVARRSSYALVPSTLLCVVLYKEMFALA